MPQLLPFFSVGVPITWTSNINFVHYNYCYTLTWTFPVGIWRPCWWRLISSFSFLLIAEGSCRSLLYLKKASFHIVGGNGWDSPPCGWPSHSSGWSSADCESYTMKESLMTSGSSVVIRTLSLPLMLVPLVTWYLCLHVGNAGNTMPTSLLASEFAQYIVHIYRSQQWLWYCTCSTLIVPLEIFHKIWFFGLPKVEKICHSPLECVNTSLWQ